jgi:cobalt-zinc-cadmium efflux system membrane fusion protein
MKKNPIQTAALLFAVLALAACGNGETTAAETAKPSAASPDEAAHSEAGHKEGEEEEAGHDEHGEEGHDEGAVKLTAEQLKAAGIAVITAAPGSIRESLPLYGVITPNAERVRQVSARFPGAIRSVSKKVGDTVREGETLAVIESNESLRSYSLTAPLSGVVTERNANPGEQAGDKSLFTVADLSSVWVELSLFPRDVAKVRVGQKVRVKGADIPQPGDGTVVYVAPFGSAANQTLSARVLLDNADRRWAPGLYVTAEVTLTEATVPLAIRSEGLQNHEGKNVVFVLDADGFEPRPVQLGRSDGERTEVLSGLAAGDKYASANSFILKAELGKGSAEHAH